MKLHQTQTEFNCGIDLHARNMYICVVDREGAVKVHRNIRNNDFNYFLRLVEPYRDDLTVTCESTFNWYWLHDACEKAGIRFVLGHALYMKAIHGTKTKNDKIDSQKIAHLLRSNMLPEGYCCSSDRRPLRALLRQRMQLIHMRTRLTHHMGGTAQSNGMEPILKKDVWAARKNGEVPERFKNDFWQLALQLDTNIMECIDRQIQTIENALFRHSRKEERRNSRILQSVPGIGDILSLTIIHEIDDISRFASVNDFASYCRLSPPNAESAGKIVGRQGAKMGNQYLKWAFTQAAVIAKRGDGPIQRMVAKIESKKGKCQANAILAHRLGRTVYHMLKNGQVFDLDKFVKGGIRKQK